MFDIKAIGLRARHGMSSFNIPNDTSDFIAGVMAGDTARAELSLLNGACVDGFDHELKIPLNLAMDNNDLPMIKLLLANGADVNLGVFKGNKVANRSRESTVHPTYEIALQYGLKNSSLEIVKFLYEECDSHDWGRAEGYACPYCLAIQRDDPSFIEYLYKRGEEVLNTPAFVFLASLSKYASNDQHNIISEVAHHSKKTSPGNYFNLITQATGAKQITGLISLIRKMLNKKDRVVVARHYISELHCAAGLTDTDKKLILQDLMKLAGNRSFKIEKSNALAYMASKDKDLAIHMVSLGYGMQEGSRVARGVALDLINPGISTEVLESFMSSYKGKLDYPEEMGSEQSLLCAAIEDGCFEAAFLLIDQFEYPANKNEGLRYSILAKSISIMSANELNEFIGRGADVSSCSGIFSSPLVRAAIGNGELMEVLLKHDPSIIYDTMLRSNDNAMDISIKSQNIEAIKILIEHGFNINRPMHTGESYIGFCERHAPRNSKFESIISLLEQESTGRAKALTSETSAFEL